MADAQATEILLFGDGKFDRLTLPKKTAGDDLQIGDLLKLTAGEIEKMAADTDDATFIGICGTLSADAAGPSQILVYLKCVIQMPMTSATYLAGAGLKWVSAALVADGAANTIAHAWDSGTTVTTLRVLIDVINLQKVFPVSA